MKPEDVIYMGLIFAAVIVAGALCLIAFHVKRVADSLASPTGGK